MADKDAESSAYYLQQMYFAYQNGVAGAAGENSSGAGRYAPGAGTSQGKPPGTSTPGGTNVASSAAASGGFAALMSPYVTQQLGLGRGTAAAAVNASSLLTATLGGGGGATGASGGLPMGLGLLGGPGGPGRPGGATLPVSVHHARQLEQLEIARQASAPHYHARVAAQQARTGAAVAAALGDRAGTKSDGALGSALSMYSENGADATGRGGAASRWTALDLGGMAVRNLSVSLFQYEFLTHLYLNHNQLAFLPREIGRLQALVVLNLTGNKLMALPSEVGLLVHLRELLLFDNQLAALPFELGFLYQLEELGLEGNPLNEGLLSLLQKDGVAALVHYLRDSCPVSAQPQEREWVALGADPPAPGAPGVYTVLNYNVLCEKYASPQSYAYVPSWVLNWEYRRELVLQEIYNYDADLVCLQEVEMAQFDEYFSPQLAAAEYDGVFFAKSRAKTMDEMGRRSVDGCAIFFKKTRFALLQKHVVEFQQLAMQKPEFRKHEDIFSRVMIKDNIAALALLEAVDSRQRLLVANVHLHWDPHYRDVKILQTAMLLDEIQRLFPQYAQPHPGRAGPSAVASRQYFNSLAAGASDATATAAALKNLPRLPVLVCGDFNSTPDSGVYALVNDGFVPAEHDDMSPPPEHGDVSGGAGGGPPAQGAAGSTRQSSSGSLADPAGESAGECGGSESEAAVSRRPTLAAVYPHGIRHALPLRSAYAQVDRLQWTNWTPTFRGLIDYVFYDTRLISVLGVLGPVDSDYCRRHVGFPNWHHPSDHVPLVVQIGISDTCSK